MPENIPETPQKVYVGVGKFIHERSPGVKTEKIMKLYDEKILPKLDGKANEIAVKLRPVFETYAKVAGITQTALELELSAAALIGAGVVGKNIIDKIRLANVMKRETKRFTSNTAGEAVAAVVASGTAVSVASETAGARSGAEPSRVDQLVDVAKNDFVTNVLGSDGFKHLMENAEGFAEGTPAEQMLYDGKVGAIENSEGETMILVHHQVKPGNETIPHQPDVLEALIINKNFKTVTSVLYWDAGHITETQHEFLPPREQGWNDYYKRLTDKGDYDTGTYANENEYSFCTPKTIDNMTGILRTGVQNKQLEKKIANHLSKNQV